jgi:GPH family glycoside/pentoside/hexuronide:cation symporter
MKESINTQKIICYAILAFPLAFLAMPIYIYLPNFYVNNFAISLQSVALVLLISRIFDAFLDPFLGIIGDKYSHLKTKIIAFSAPILGIAFIFLFYPSASSNLSWWLFICLFITYFFFSLIQINYQSLAVGFSDNYNLKTKIIAIREAIGVMGIIFASTAPALLFLYFSEVKSFLIIGIFYLILISFCAAIFYFKAPQPAISNAKIGHKLDLSFLKNRQLKYLFTIFFFNSLTFGITASLMLFFVEIVLNAKNFTSLFLLLYFGGLLLGIPFWTKLSEKLQNKEKAWKIAMILIVIIFAFCGFLKEGDIVFYALICAASGFCFAADYCLSYSILTDVIQSQKLTRSTSTIFGGINFIIKFCFAFASGVLLFGLGKVQENAPDLQTNFLLISYCLIPCCFKIFTYIFLNQFQKTYA